MRFLVFVGACVAGFIAGNALGDQDWSEFWAWFAIWSVAIVILLATRRD